MSAFGALANRGELDKVFFIIAEKTGRMKPVPPCDDLRDETWAKVDKLVKQALDAMVKAEVKQPLHRLSEIAVEEAFADPDKGVQTAAYRIMDTRLLVDESRRVRGILTGPEPWILTLPEPIMRPPSISYEEVKGPTTLRKGEGYEVFGVPAEGSPKSLLKAIIEELGKRGLAKKKQE